MVGCSPCPTQGAGNLLECALGSYTSGVIVEWQLPDGFERKLQLPVGFDADGAAGRVAAGPDVWTDGSLDEDKVSGASSSGSGFFSCRSGRLWAHRR